MQAVHRCLVLVCYCTEPELVPKYWINGRVVSVYCVPAMFVYALHVLPPESPQQASEAGTLLLLFIDEDIEAQRGSVTFPPSHSQGACVVAKIWTQTGLFSPLNSFLWKMSNIYRSSENSTMNLRLLTSTFKNDQHCAISFICLPHMWYSFLEYFNPGYHIISPVNTLVSLCNR